MSDGADSSSGDRQRAPGPGPAAWLHRCERCGERMVEQQCKIICMNCGYHRDCSDP